MYYHHCVCAPIQADQQNLLTILSLKSGNGEREQKVFYCDPDCYCQGDPDHAPHSLQYKVFDAGGCRASEMALFARTSEMVTTKVK